MVTNVGTGSNSYVRYAYESVFNTAPADSSLTTYFGHNVRFTVTPKNNIERISNLNTRNYTKYVAKGFEGTFSVDFQVSNFNFLKGVIGGVSTSGAGPYTHTYSEANTPSGATIQTSEDLDTDSERTLTGCLFDKATLTLNQGELVTGRIDGVYAKEVKDATLNANGNASDSDCPFTFAHGSLTLSGSNITEVQSLECSIINNAELIKGLGSRFATQRAFKQRVYEFRVTKVREQDTDFLDKFYDGGNGSTGITNPGTPVSGANLILALDNGKTGTELRSLVVKFDNIAFEDPSMTFEPAEVNKEGITLYATNLNVASGAVVVNNTATHP